MKIIPSFQFLSDSQKKKKLTSNLNNIINIIRVIIPANNATITPPLGPLLGQYGINIVEFCNEFNRETEHIAKDIPIVIEIFLFSDKSYYFEIKGPVYSVLLKDALNVEETVDKEVFLKIAYEILLLKIHMNNDKEFQKLNLEIRADYFKSIISELIGTAKSIGLLFK